MKLKNILIINSAIILFILNAFLYLYHSNINYLLLFSFILCILLFKDCKYYYFLFLPHNLIIIYCVFTFYFGYLSYSYGLRHNLYVDLIRGNIEKEIFYMNIIIFSVSLFLRRFDKYFLQKYDFFEFKPINNMIFFIVCILLLGFFYILGHGGYTIGLRIFFVSIITIYLLNKNILIKLLAYSYVITITMLTSFEDKREVILVFLSILMTICFYYKVKLSFKNLILPIFFVFVFYILIVVSSILRGYGSFELDSLNDLLFAVVEYSKLDKFGYIISENLELLHAFPVYIITMKHWVLGGEPLFYGVTLITPFFIIFPRDLFLNKPDGAVNYFTNFVSPSYWEVGGSLPVIIINEFIMNFGLIGCVIFVLFVYLITSVLTINHILRMKFVVPIIVSFSLTFFISIRGSGLEMSVIAFLPVLLLLLFIHFKDNK